MLVASLHEVTAHYGTQIVLDGVTFQIQEGEKLGLIGRNGSGKTTLLRILAGELRPASGRLVMPDSTTIGYVPQYIETEGGSTVLEFLLTDYHRTLERLREAEKRLESASGGELDRALSAYQRVCDAYDGIDGDNFARQASAMLVNMGLGGKERQAVGSLSGGEQNVLSMTRALLSKPDLLVLDEPGNHLDFLGLAWLEGFLSTFKGAVLIVSHNRYLLDRVATGILHLENGRVSRYEGNYSAYRAQHLRQLLAQQSDYIANQKRLARLEALVRRFEQIARSSDDNAWGRRLRARRSQLARERRDAVERPNMDTSTIQAHFESQPTQADIAVHVRGYTKGFGEDLLFDDAEMEVAGGERVALIGANGTGKSTLLHDIVELGSWESENIRVGPSMRVGYSAQQQETLDDDHTIIESVRSVGPMTSQTAFGILRAFLFEHEEMTKRVGALSGGERNRLQLACLMAAKPNFLILDEPTNHMDIPSREAVEEALEDFRGSLLVVSHDRYFLDKVAERVIEVRDRKLSSYPGNFSEFWRARGIASRSRTGVSSRKRVRRQPERVERARHRQSVANLERRIEEAEARRVELEGEMAEAFASRQMRRGRRAQRRLDSLSSELESLYDRWTTAAGQ